MRKVTLTAFGILFLASQPCAAQAQMFEAMASDVPESIRAAVEALRPPGRVLGFTRSLESGPTLAALLATPENGLPVRFMVTPRIAIAAGRGRIEQFDPDGDERAFGWAAPLQVTVANETGGTRTLSGRGRFVFSRTQKWGRIETAAGTLLMVPMTSQYQATIEVDPKEFPDEDAPQKPGRDAAPTAPVSIASPKRGCVFPDQPQFGGPQIRLGILYTRAAMEKARRLSSDVPQEPCQMIQGIGFDLNDSLLHSQVLVRFQLVGIGRADGYSEPTAGGVRMARAALSDLLDRGTNLGNAAALWRKNMKADVVVLLIATDEGCGAAEENLDKYKDRDRALAVADAHCAVGNNSAAHEIGHIMGLRHDRNADSASSPFPWGHGFVHHGQASFMTIMGSRATCKLCKRSNKWSNPTMPPDPSTGVTIGDPTFADEARVIREVAPEIIKFRNQLLP